MNYVAQTQKRNFKTPIIIGFFLIICITTVLAVWILNRPTNTKSKAAASTTLSFSPASQNVGVGQLVSSDVTLDPGNNQVSVMKLVISYDLTKFNQQTASISPILANPSSTNTQGFIQILQPVANNCSGTTCLMSITLSVGSSPNYVITQPLKVATVSLNAIAPTDTVGTSVIVDQSSQVYSLASSDQAGQNVLQFSSLTPLTVIIGPGGSPTPPICTPNQSTCSWDPVSGATNYHVKITNVNSGNPVQEGDISAPQTSVQFPSIADQTYNCSVTVTNACGAVSNPGQATKTCPVSPTPTPSSCPTPGSVQHLRLICPNGNNCNNQ